MIKMRTGWMPKTLLALFLATAVFASLAFAQGMMRGQDRPRQGMQGMMNWKDELKLTPDQEKKLEEFRKARVKEQESFMDEMTKLRREMRDLMDNPKANQSKLEGLIDKMSKVRAEREKAALKNRLEWEKIFTAEQLEKIRSFRGGMMLGPMGRMGMRMAPGRFHMGRFGMFGRRGCPGGFCIR